MSKLLYTIPVTRRGVRATAEVYQEPLGTRSVYVSYAPGEEGELTQRELNEVTQQALDARYHSTPGETALEFLGIAAMAGVGWWALTGLSTLKK